MSVTTIGFKEFEDKLRNMDKKTRTVVGGYVQEALAEWEILATNSAPRGQVAGGNLAQHIRNTYHGNMSGELTSGAHYSAYVEWGTGAKVRVPADLQAYAIQFKGVKAVAGRFPHPYFFIHKPTIQNSLYSNVLRYLSTPQ